MKKFISKFRVLHLGSHCATIGLVACFAAMTATDCRSQQLYWPTDGWRTSSPEAQGIDSGALVDAFDYIRQHRLPIHSLLIVRNGYVVLDAYFYPYAAGERHDVASVTKSVTSTLVGIAIGKGQIRGVNQPLLSLFKGIPVTNLDERKRNIAIQDLLTMTSGLDCHFNQGEITLRQMEQSKNWVEFALGLPMSDKPGEHFEYCSPGMHLLSGVLTRVSKTSALDYARRELFMPLSITDVVWPADRDGVTHGWGDLQLQPRDMAKLGYLWLNEGRWNGKQIVPEAYLRAATQVHSHAPWEEDYGYGIWVYPQVAGGLFEANGRGGQRISVLPTKNMVLVMTGGGFEPGEIGKFLLASVKSDGVLAENSIAISKLRAAMAAAAGPLATTTTAAPRLPDTAFRISGKLYDVASNPLDLASFQVNFSADSNATLQLNFSDSHSEKLSMGMGGVPKLSGSGVERTAVVGSFEDAETLFIDYNQIARINHIELRLRFTGNRVTIQLREKTGGDQVDFSGQQR
jgi:CubicO group peptidase (beta-lactamase class C family)